MADFPVAPVQITPFDKETQGFASEWYAYYNTLSSQLRDNFGNTAYVFPNQPETNLQQSPVTNVTQSITYNSTTGRMNVNNSNEYEELATITRKSTAELVPLTTPATIGRIFYDTDTNTLKVNLDGASLVSIDTT